MLQSEIMVSKVVRVKIAENFYSQSKKMCKILFSDFELKNVKSKMYRKIHFA